MESKITKENIATANYNKDLKDINEEKIYNWIIENIFK